MIFENVKLYTTYLWNAVNHIVFEFVIMGNLLHNYKPILQNSKDNNKIDENSIKELI